MNELLVSTTKNAVAAFKDSKITIDMSLKEEQACKAIVQTAGIVCVTFAFVKVLSVVKDLMQPRLDYEVTHRRGRYDE